MRQPVMPSSSAGVAVVALLLMASFPKAQARDPFDTPFGAIATASDVSFTIATDRRTYHAGEQILVSYEIVNLSAQPLYVPRYNGWCPSVHVHVWLEDVTGRHSGGAYVRSDGASCMMPFNETFAARAVKEFVLPKPGEHLKDEVYKGSFPVSGLKPGIYRLEGKLQGWTTNDGEPPAAELAKLGAPVLMGEVPASMPDKIEIVR